MSLLNKSFKDNSTGETVTIDEIRENIVTLNNGDMVATERILDNSHYEEVVDPNSFFSKQSSSLLGNIMDKVKSIKTDNMVDENTISNSIKSGSSEFSPSSNESAVIQVSEEDERAELMRKYNITDQPKTVSPEELLGETPTGETQPVQNTQQTYNQPPVQQQVQVEDPIISMFKNVKRIVDFKLDFSIEEKIPRIDFIEMMEDSYNTSIIEYLADEFTNKLLKDPSIIKNVIKEKIESLVKQDDVVVVETKKTTVKKPTTRKTTAKKPVAKKPVAKKTTTRKPRVKKVDESNEESN